MAENANARGETRHDSIRRKSTKTKTKKTRRPRRTTRLIVCCMNTTDTCALHEPHVPPIDRARVRTPLRSLGGFASFLVTLDGGG